MAEAKKKTSPMFEPQYFEIREVGKRIKSTKKQYIWRFALDGRDVTVELFNSKMSSKKKIMVNGQLKAEMKQKSENFMYQMNIHGKRVTIQACNDGFDIVYDGTMFQVLWEQAKRKNTFTWENKNKKHDPFAVHAFGDAVGNVIAPTTREQGTKEAIELQVLGNEEEEFKYTITQPCNTIARSQSRKQAINLMEMETAKFCEEMRSAFGKDEAEECIQSFMNGRYKQMKKEIDQKYPVDGNNESRSRKEQERAAAKAKKRKEEDLRADKEQEDAFESGFDHGFDRMATFNGRSVGKEGDQAQTASISDSSTPQQAPTAAPVAPAQQPAAANFDFNFDGSPAQQNTGQPVAQVDLDDLLSGNSIKRTGSQAAKQVDIFEFDNVGQQQPQQQQFNNNISDPFANLSSANVALSGAPQQQQPAGSGFVPNPMSHKQEAAQMMMQQQQQQMMAMMAQQQQYQTNMMMQQQMMSGQGGQNPFNTMPGSANPFMTNPMMQQQPQYNPNAAFNSFQVPQPGQPQPPQSQNPFANI